MSKISRSPKRHTFQKEKYIERMKEKGEAVNEDYLAMFESYAEQHKAKFEDPDDRIENMEYDLLTTDWILEKVRAHDAYAQNLYAAMCNNGFIRLEVIPVLKGEEWSCSWRYAGGIVADMRQQGDYIDWYCSGIRNDYQDEKAGNLYDQRKYVPEGCITDEIRSDLRQLGWAVAPGGDWENFEKGD